MLAAPYIHSGSSKHAMPVLIIACRPGIISCLSAFTLKQAFPSRGYRGDTFALSCGTFPSPPPHVPAVRRVLVERLRQQVVAAVKDMLHERFQ